MPITGTSQEYVVATGKGGSYWGPYYFRLFIWNLFNTDPCYAQHKLANDPQACDKLYQGAMQLLMQQAPNEE